MTSSSSNTLDSRTNRYGHQGFSFIENYPVFTAYEQTGNVVQLPLDLSTANGQLKIPNIKSLRLTINLLTNAVTRLDLKNNTRPVETLMGNVRLMNCGGQPCD